MKPDATLHQPDPRYLRELIAQAGLTQAEAARRIGISSRTLRQYIADSGAKTWRRAPYSVQFALENLK